MSRRFMIIEFFASLSLEKIENEATHAAVLKKIKADMGQLCDSKDVL